MAAETDGEWPLPSESAPLRWLLSVAEGMMFGAGVLGFIAFELAVIAFVIDSPIITVGMAVFGVIALLLTARNLWFTRVIHQSAPDKGPRMYRDSAYRDWWGTRSWRLVGTIAVITGAAAFIFSFLPIGFEPLEWALFAMPALWVVVCVGFLIWSYAIYNIRGSLLH